MPAISDQRSNGHAVGSRQRRPQILAVIATCLLSVQSLSARPITFSQQTKGTLVVCGGGSLPDSVLDAFRKAAGDEPRLIVIPTASSREVDAQAIQKLWHERGFARVSILHTTDRSVAATREFVAPLLNATAVWLGGGSQQRIADAYVGTPVETELHCLLNRGGVIGGTSAGAAVQSKVMIASGRSEPKISTGFDFVKSAIIDQHFLARNRMGRLRSAVRQNPQCVGFGIDEGTALVIRADETATVVGRGVVVRVENIAGKENITSISANRKVALTKAPLNNAMRPTVEFKRLVLTDKYYCDGAACADINGDGKIDVVAGPFWYAGPDFQTAHAFYEPVEIPKEPSPSNSMFSFVHDFSGDGKPDILVLGRVHKHAAMWYENPGNVAGYWKRHFAFERVRGESPTLADLDGDGIPQVITHWEGRWGWIAPDPQEPDKPWAFTAIGENEDWPRFYHGEGVGDVNGDDRLDVIINDGWYEQPAKLTDQTWKFHRMRFSRERGGAQMFAVDVDGDGDNDVISSLHAHEWGLAWFEQSNSGKAIRFSEHTIMGDRSQISKYRVAFSQPHALAIADLNSDGLPDIITGKRMWAHGPRGDIEPSADPVVYWFELVREPNGQVRYVPHEIDSHSGVGVQISTADLDANGAIDIVTASKLGTFVFLNQPGKTNQQKNANKESDKR